MAFGGSEIAIEDTVTAREEHPALELPTAPPRTPATPGEPGRYVILRRLGSGGMGVVYKVFDHKMERFVAVKRLNPRREKADGALPFFNEAKAIARLNHPNIVAIYDIVEDRRGHFIVMEIVPGLSVRLWVKRHGPLAPVPGAAILRQIAEALCYAHRHGIVHRDVKPGNILVGRGLVPKIVDFGVAVVGEEASRTASGRIAGTRGYMAPEVRWNRGAVDPRADVYSFGMTVLEAFAGAKPWLVHRYPPLVADFVMRATRENPKDRFPSMVEALEDWRRIEASVQGQKESVPEAVLRAVSPPPVRHDVVEVISPQGDRRTVHLSEPVTLVGRSREKCAIALDDTETSRIHLKLVREDGEVYAFDMGSHNGTFVAGQVVKAVKLAEGMEIRVGNTVLRYL
jgi:hypothetical protein